MFKAILFTFAAAAVVTAGAAALNSAERLQSLACQAAAIASPEALQRPDADAKLQALQQQAAAVAGDPAAASTIAHLFVPLAQCAKER